MWGRLIGGYSWFEQLTWVDAFRCVAMNLGVMVPVDVLQTTNGKTFARLDALFSGIFFIGITGIVMATVAHRLPHTLHADASICVDRCVHHH